MQQPLAVTELGDATTGPLHKDVGYLPSSTHPHTCMHDIPHREGLGKMWDLPYKSQVCHVNISMGVLLAHLLAAPPLRGSVL